MAKKHLELEDLVADFVNDIKNELDYRKLHLDPFDKLDLIEIVTKEIELKL